MAGPSHTVRLALMVPPLKLKPFLWPGEELLWAGRPDPEVRFPPADGVDHLWQQREGAFYANSGMDFFMRCSAPVGLFDVADPDWLLALLARIQGQ
jgi:hypothetical protein